eukprot:3562807-Amphidinium_carterae.2
MFQFALLWPAQLRHALRGSSQLACTTFHGLQSELASAMHAPSDAQETPEPYPTIAKGWQLNQYVRLVRVL